MKTDIERLEKVIKEQAKQINNLKKALTVLQTRIIQVSKKTNRSYETGRKNANDINNITDILRRNR